MALMNLLPLLGKRLEDLSIDDLKAVKNHFKIDVEVTPELHKLTMKMLTDSDIDSVADLIQSPDQIKKLLGFFKSQSEVVEERSLKQCPHCDNFFLV